MDPIKIGSTIPVEKTHRIIETIPLMKKANINYEEYKNRYIYIFSQKKKRDDLEFLNNLVNFIQSTIDKFYIKNLIVTRIKQTSKQIDNYNLEEFTREIYSLMSDEDLFVYEKEKINREIFDYLTDNNIFIIDGYLRFRPNSFNDLIDKALHFTEDYIQLDMDYDEFINMLKSFVDEQNTEVELVNVIFQGNEFKLLDSHSQDISSDYIIAMLEELFYEEINQSDVLLSALIGLAPENIIVHSVNSEHKEIMKILKEVFEDKIHLCKGCSLCNNQVSHKKD